VSTGGERPPLLTLGHSTRTLEALIELLRVHEVTRVADVRTLPRSRRHPHFDRAPLAASLASNGILYAHCPDLGGLRKPRPDSVHTGLKDEGLRGFADHMETPAFDAALVALLAWAAGGRTTILCAEAVPDRCHRALISDALLARGIRVEHIVDGDSRRLHALTTFASVSGWRVTYPGTAPRLPGL
jgi:uncharacterized protein (DUF488 family)